MLSPGFFIHFSFHNIKTYTNTLNQYSSLTYYLSIIFNLLILSYRLLVIMLIFFFLVLFPINDKQAFFKENRWVSAQHDHAFFFVFVFEQLLLFVGFYFFSFIIGQLIKKIVRGIIKIYALIFYSVSLIDTLNACNET